MMRRSPDAEAKAASEWEASHRALLQLTVIVGLALSSGIYVLAANLTGLFS